MSIPPLTSSLSLSGCREVWQRMGQPDNIGRMIDLLERAVFESPGLAFDTAKSLVESVCRTVLADRAVVVDTAWDVPKLLRQTLLALSLVPDGHGSETADILRRVAGGLQTTAQALGELRSKEGLLGHGKEAYAKQLEALQALFAARAADTVIHFLYMAHADYPAISQEPALALEDQPNFNQYVDDLHEIRIFDADYQASEVLFRVDPEAYRNYLDLYLSEPSDGEDLG